MEEEEKKEPGKEVEIGTKIASHLATIKGLSEVETQLMNTVQIFKEEDLEKAFALTDAIEEECQEIVSLLFELRDALKL
jgi:hypothetical protein